MKEISFRTDVLPLKNELFRLALRITLNRDDAEDVVQETMMKVWNRREQWAADRVDGGLLYDDMPQRGAGPPKKDGEPERVAGRRRQREHTSLERQNT